MSSVRNYGGVCVSHQHKSQATPQRTPIAPTAAIRLGQGGSQPFQSRKAGQETCNQNVLSPAPESGEMQLFSNTSHCPTTEDIACWETGTGGSWLSTLAKGQQPIGGPDSWYSLRSTARRSPRNPPSLLTKADKPLVAPNCVRNLDGGRPSGTLSGPPAVVSCLVCVPQRADGLRRNVGQPWAVLGD